MAGGKLKKIAVAGGPPQTIADTAAVSGSWNSDGVILFNTTSNSPLSRVSIAGGAVSLVTSLEPGEVRHAVPQFLPDGQHFLYAGAGNGVGIYVGSLNGKARTLLLRDAGGQVAYSEGRLFFVRADTLMTQRFDAVALTPAHGEPSPVAEIPAGIFSVSTTGVLAYQSGTNANRTRLEWFDRAGTSLGALGEVAKCTGGNLARWLARGGRHPGVRRFGRERCLAVDLTGTAGRVSHSTRRIPSGERSGRRSTKRVVYDEETEGARQTMICFRKRPMARAVSRRCWKTA